MKKTVTFIIFCSLAIAFIITPSCKKEGKNEELPIITASYNESLITAGNVTFTIQVTNGSNYDIDFGDGNSSLGNSINSSNAFTITHTYTNNRTFAVKITAYNSEQKSTSYNLSVIVKNVKCLSFNEWGNDGVTETKTSVSITCSKNIPYNIYAIKGVLVAGSSDDFFSIGVPIYAQAGDTITNYPIPNFVMYWSQLYKQTLWCDGSNGGRGTIYITELTSNSIRGTFFGELVGSPTLPYTFAHVTSGAFYVSY